MGILQLLAKENYIAYSKPLAKIVGIDEAILFGELCSMSNLFGYEFFCEQSRLCDDTCMTEYRVRNATKNLKKFGLITVEKKGIPAKNYYTLNENRFLEIVNCQSTSGTKFDSTGNDNFDSTRDNNFDSTFNKNQTNKNQTNKNQKNNTTSFEEEFEELWRNYPNKKGKPNALKAYIKARKKGTSLEDIQNGLNKYIKECEIKKTEKQYIKHGSTWFNQQCWLDDYMTEDNNNGENQRDTTEEAPRMGIYI